MLQHPIQLNNFVGSGKGTASRGMPAGMGSSAGRGNTAHQRSGTGRSTRALGLEGLGGGAVAGAAEAAVKLQDKSRQHAGPEGSSRAAGLNRGSSYALGGAGGLLGAGVQSSSVIIGKRPEKYRASSGSRPGNVGASSGVATAGHYGGNGLKPHHNLITGTSTFGGGLLSGLNNGREGGGIHESRSSNLQNPAMYSVAGPGAPPTSINMNMSKSLEHHQNMSLSLAERKYTEIAANFKKREKQNKELIEQLNKKLKAQEKKSSEETKISIELKKRHDIMQKKLQMAVKEKAETSKQLKQLFILFTKQRKALELSIKKNKKFEFEQQTHESALKEKERATLELRHKVDQLESQKELMQQRHRQEVENMSHELQEKRLTLQRFQNDLAEGSEQKLMLKTRLDEYEDKIKTLIKEFEDESKRHIAEMSDTHEQYRGYKTKAQELEQRIEKYQQEALDAQKQERKARRELVQLTFENDEIDEKCHYLEQKYHALVKRMGASQEDIDAIEEEIMLKNEGAPRPTNSKARKRGQPSYPHRKSRVSGPNANLVNKRGHHANMGINSGDSDDEALSDPDHDDMVRGRDLANDRSGGQAQRYGKVGGMKYDGVHRLVDSGPIVDGALEAGDGEEDLQSLPDDRDSQNQSRLEHMRGGRDGTGMHNRSLRSGDGPGSTARNQGALIQGNHHSGGMVDSYEIYGENQADDSDMELEEEMISYSNKRRGPGMKTAAGRGHGDAIADDIMISGEQSIEPSKMGQADYDGRRRRTSSSNTKGQRRISQKRESSGVKKTNIEVLDHETPIEEYQQYYQEMQEGNVANAQKEMRARQALPIQHPQQMQDQLEPMELGGQSQQLMSGVGQPQQHTMQDMQNTLGTESNDLFNNLFTNLSTNQSLQNEYIKQQFKLELIKDEEDLHNYKNLLNAMAAIFFTSHNMKKSCQTIFSEWLQKTRDIQKERGGPLPYKGMKKKPQAPGQVSQPGRAVPAIEIDTELANAQYENQHDLELQMQEEGLEETANGATGPYHPGDNLNGPQDRHAAESPDNLLDHQNDLNEDPSGSARSGSGSSSDEDALPPHLANDPDAVHDHQVKKFLKNLQKVGPFSKQILNYSYPPLLYQRGDDSEDEDGDQDEEELGDEYDEDPSQHNESLDDQMGDLRGRELCDPEDPDEENADLRQQQLEELVDGLAVMPPTDAENRQLEDMIDGFFAQKRAEGGQGDGVIHEPGAAASPGAGIEPADVSEIHKMINRSGESASPGLDQLDQDMLDGLQLDEDVLDDDGHVMADYVGADQDFYDNLKQVVGQHDADGIEPEIAGDVDMDMMAGGLGEGRMRIDDGFGDLDGSDGLDYGSMGDLDDHHRFQ